MTWGTGSGNASAAAKDPAFSKTGSVAPDAGVPDASVAVAPYAGVHDASVAPDASVPGAPPHEPKASSVPPRVVAIAEAASAWGHCEYTISAAVCV